MNATDGSLAGLRVLVPRALSGTDPVVVALTASGARPVVVPLIRTVPPADPTVLDDTLLAVEAGHYAWVAVTSAATVPVLVDRAEQAGTPLAVALAATRVAAVGPATARALRGAGVHVDLVPPGGSSATDLLAVWPTPPTGATSRRVLLPHADLAPPTLATGLRARGWDVEEVVAYRTLPGPVPDEATRASWSAGDIGAVVLTSGSTARHLLELLGAPPVGTLVVCLGPSTAGVARALGLVVAAVADEQTPAGLVAALVACRTDPTSPRTLTSETTEVNP